MDMDARFGSVAALAQPMDLAGLALRNRIVMAPMTRERAPEGVPTNEMAEYYARRAEGGVALIVTEGAAPNEEGRFGRDVPRLYGADALAGWERIVRRVHAGGAKIFAQIWHVGSFTPSMVGMEDSLGLERLSPSGLAAPGRFYGREMTVSEISRTIADYAQAARAARDIGFDGVEIHAAHGYLPDQFFWAETNHRQDAYGGDLQQRSRFAVEIILACKAMAGDAFPVTLRLSQWKQHDYSARVADSPEQLADWLTPLVRAGADGFHVSTRRFWEPAFPGNELSPAAWVRRLTGKPVIAVGSVMLKTDFKAHDGKLHSTLVPESLQRVSDGIDQGEFDMIALGRALLANPTLPQCVLSGDMTSLRNYDRSFLDRLI
ncbi:12-oxophytodienoate reductase [Microvirga sp. 2YAF29]|uniref:oxidoreductase n=1 Tax=Microvirga sp. 2YAF29 TaxID=3233031 RepID=UPI003F9C0E72